MSFIENTENKLKCVNYTPAHSSMENVSQVFNIENKLPVFGMVVHEMNKSNEMNRTNNDLYTLDDVKKEFWG